MMKTILIKKKMNKYKVIIETITHEFWECWGKDEEDAIENYFDGEHYYTKPKADNLIHIEEIKEFGGLKNE